MSENYTQTNQYVQSVDNQRGQPPAQTVGTEFSRQFYLVLTQQPSLAHRFYTDGSSLTNAVAGALGVTVYGQTAINEKIMSMNLEGAHVEVESVDAQYSLRGGVAVLITGQLTKVGKERRPFVQSFFLATQERGYYVLNDTFRYMEPQKEVYPAAPGSVTSVQHYGSHHEGNGYSNLGAPSSGQPQHSHAPQEPHPQASPFQHANGHLHAPPANPDLGSGFSSGHSSGDLAQIPSPPPSQGLPPPPPRPDAASIAPAPTPPQQAPTAPSHEPPTEQEPEQSSNEEQQPQPQQQQAPQEKGSSNDQPVPQPAVDQNRPPVKPQRRPSAPAPQEAQRKGSGQQSAGAPAPARTAMSYAARVKAETPASAPNQQSGRPHTPSQPAAAPPTAAAAQPTSPSTAAPFPPRASGNRNQGRHAPTAGPAPAAAGDTSGKGDQRGGASHGASLDNKPSGNNGTGSGPPARPPYSAPGRGPAQGYRDDESSKKAVFVRNVPQDATSQAIRDLFSQFGTIKPQNGAITVKHNGNNNSFAYVDFVDVASAQSCVEAKDLQLNGVTLDITPKRASFGGGRGGGRYGGRVDGRGPGGYGRGRGGDRGLFSGRSGPPAGSFSEDAQTGTDRPQGNRQNPGGQGPVRGRGGRDGVRGRGRGGARTPTTSQPAEVAPPVAE